jgi:4-hydroxy-tetrahydrodipicolinate synthase
VPLRTAQPLSPQGLHDLAATPNIQGIKLAPGALDSDVVAFLAEPPDDFTILCGDDVLLSPMLALGAHGGIVASAHLATADFAGLIAAWQAGDAGQARAQGRRLAVLARALFAEPNPTVIKAALHADGRIPTAQVRLPLLPATPRVVSKVLTERRRLWAGRSTP